MAGVSDAQGSSGETYGTIADWPRLTHDDLLAVRQRDLYVYTIYETLTSGEPIAFFDKGLQEIVHWLYFRGDISADVQRNAKRNHLLGSVVMLDEAFSQLSSRRDFEIDIRPIAEQERHAVESASEYKTLRLIERVFARGHIAQAQLDEARQSLYGAEKFYASSRDEFVRQFGRGMLWVVADNSAADDGPQYIAAPLHGIAFVLRTDDGVVDEDTVAAIEPVVTSVDGRHGLLPAYSTLVGGLAMKGMIP